MTSDHPASLSEPDVDRATVRRIGAGVPYVDGSEDALLAIVRAAADRSSTSDELEAHIVDWPTRYHLSQHRANLVRPLRLRPGQRVLDVGAGTGAIARYLGEQGAEVVALEGNPARAEVAAARCEGLPNVEVLCGTIHDLDPDEHFDVVAVIGVLEYSIAPIGGGRGPLDLLGAVQSRLRPGGALCLAIENQLGLKYLMGGAEDHRGVPWIGLEDYPGPPGPRTWTRQELAGMLRQAGLVEQRWLAPFPDYKLPSLVLHEQVYDHPRAEELIEQLVLEPVAFPDALPARRGDAVAAHGTLVRAGLGLDATSSFLVVAAPTEAAVRGLVDDGTMAWLYGGHRRSMWRRARELRTSWRLVPDGDTSPRSSGWLTQDPGAERPFELGATLGQEIDRAIRAHDEVRLSEVLRRWWAELERRASSTAGAGGTPGSPFAAQAGGRSLPDGHLDVSPSNFVDRGDGNLVLIDDEWRIGGPVDMEMAAHRALWVLAQQVVGSGISHPWGDTASVGSLVERFAAMIDLQLTPERTERLLAAELELQALVTGASVEHLRSGWLDGDRTGLEMRTSVESVTVRALLAQVDELAAQSTELERRSTELEGQRDHLAGLVRQHEAELARLSTARGWLRATVRRSTALQRVRDRVGRRT